MERDFILYSVKSYWAQCESMIIKNYLFPSVLENRDCTSQKVKLLFPESQVPDVLGQIHKGTSGRRLRINKTLEKERECFYWCNCNEDVTIWCKTCLVGVATNGPRKRRKHTICRYNVGSSFERERTATDLVNKYT